MSQLCNNRQRPRANRIQMTHGFGKGTTEHSRVAEGRGEPPPPPSSNRGTYAEPGISSIMPTPGLRHLGYPFTS
jgi:hypothetical protein